VRHSAVCSQYRGGVCGDALRLCCVLAAQGIGEDWWPEVERLRRQFLALAAAGVEFKFTVTMALYEADGGVATAAAAATNGGARAVVESSDTDARITRTATFFNSSRLGQARGGGGVQVVHVQLDDATLAKTTFHGLNRVQVSTRPLSPLPVLPST
jgi:hypothetical protein